MQQNIAFKQNIGNDCIKRGGEGFAEIEATISVLSWA